MNKPIENIECIKMERSPTWGESFKADRSFISSDKIMELYFNDSTKTMFSQYFSSTLNSQKYSNPLWNQNKDDEVHKFSLSELNEKLRANIDKHEIQMPPVHYHEYPKYEFVPTLQQGRME